MAEMRVEQPGSSAKVHPYLHLLRFHLLRGAPFLAVSLVLLVFTDQILALHPRFASLTDEERGATLGWLLLASIVILTLITSQRTPRQLSLALPVDSRLAFLIEAGAAMIVGLALATSVAVFTSLRTFLGSVANPIFAVAVVLVAILMSVLLTFSAGLVSRGALFTLLTLLAWLALALGATEYAAIPYSDAISPFLLLPSLGLTIIAIIATVERLATRRHRLWKVHLGLGILLILVPGIYLLNLSWPRLGAIPRLGSDGVISNPVPHLNAQYIVHPVNAEPAAFGISNRAKGLDLSIMGEWLVLWENGRLVQVRSLRNGKIVLAPDRSEPIWIGQELYFWRVEHGVPQRLILTPAGASSSLELKWPGFKVNWDMTTMYGFWVHKEILVLNINSNLGVLSFLASPGTGSMTKLGRRSSYSSCRRFIAIANPEPGTARLFDTQQGAFLAFTISSNADPVCNDERLAVVDGTRVDVYSLAIQKAPALEQSLNLEKPLLPGWANRSPYYFERGSLYSVLMPEKPLLRLGSAPVTISSNNDGQVLLEFKKDAPILFHPATGRSWRIQLDYISGLDFWAANIQQDRLTVCGWRGCKRCSLESGRCEDVPLADIPIQWLN